MNVAEYADNVIKSAGGGLRKIGINIQTRIKFKIVKSLQRAVENSRLSLINKRFLPIFNR